MTSQPEEVEAPISSPVTLSHDPIPPIPEYEEIQELREARRRADTAAGEHQALRADYEYTENPAYAATTLV